jgi:arginine:pyruvate transaminase
LTIGEHDIGTADIILQSMYESALSGHTGYAMVPGTDNLRDAIAKRTVERTGIATTRDNVLITPGGQSALFAAHAAVCDPGDIALYLEPYYATYPGTIRGVGAKPRAIQTKSIESFQPNEDDISAASKGAKSLLINSPNNPTGTVYSRSTLQGIANVCQRHDIWLISDEVYDTQVWDGQHISPRCLSDMAKRTLVIGSMSKSHAMTGSRCGWVIGPQEAISHLISFATHTNFGVPGFIQDASVFALERGISFEKEVGAPFKRRREIALQLLNGQENINLIPSQGAMYLMLDIRSTGFSGDDFANKLLDEEHIAVMPGESFGASAAGHIRVAMTVDDDTFTKAIKTICKFAKTNN